jgi:hypothetical protein
MNDIVCKVIATCSPVDRTAQKAAEYKMSAVPAITLEEQAEVENRSRDIRPVG